MTIRDRIWGTGKQATQEEVIELTNQFYVTLRANFAQIEDRLGENADGTNKAALLRVRALLHPQEGQPMSQNWTNAYEVEQLMVHLYDDDAVKTELAVRVLEARSVLQSELATVYETQLHDIDALPAGTATAPARRRALLTRLVNDLQWRYIVNEAKRRYSKLITRRTATLSVIALTIFIAAVVLILAMRRLVFTYDDLRLLGVAGLAGTWGATFSMLATLKSRLDQSQFDDLKLMKAGSVLLSRAAIGAGAASILFFFLLSGLLGGTAFPKLTRAQTDRTEQGAPVASGDSSSSSTAGTGSTSNDRPPLPTTDLALLIVWCFIAGFSEQLIPGLLASTEARAGVTPAAPTDRFRPTTEAAPAMPANEGGTSTSSGEGGPTANAGQPAAPQPQPQAQASAAEAPPDPNA